LGDFAMFAFIEIGCSDVALIFWVPEWFSLSVSDLHRHLVAERSALGLRKWGWWPLP
jgi:hypothetical protein